MTTTVPTENYYKARKSYLLVSAVLGVWELIGVTLKKVPIDDLELEVVVRSPEAVPYALIFVLIYLAYRFSVEWKYCDEANRIRMLSRVDFALAHVLAAGAVLLFAYQKSSGVVVGNVLVQTDPTWRTVMRMTVQMAHVGLGMLVAVMLNKRLGERKLMRIGIVALGAAASVLIYLFFGLYTWADWGGWVSQPSCWS